MKSDKAERVLCIYNRLLEGKIVYKAEAAQHFGVDEKSIQRDIKDIRRMLDKNIVENGIENNVVYDRDKRGYRLEHISRTTFTSEEILAISKILLDSRAFTRNEMMQMLDKLLECCVLSDKKKVIQQLTANEKMHYVQPRHGKVFVDKMWEIGKAICEKRYIEITYFTMMENNKIISKIQPQAIMFSEFYFYLAAYSEMNVHPAIYRIDRIDSIKMLDEHFEVKYGKRFEEGEYRKRSRFLFGGDIQRTIFWYKGNGIENVLDRFPTAKIIREEEGRYLISAETVWNEIELWIRTQGKKVELVNQEKK